MLPTKKQKDQCPYVTLQAKKIVNDLLSKLTVSIISIPLKFIADWYYQYGNTSIKRPGAFIKFFDLLRGRLFEGGV